MFVHLPGIDVTPPATTSAVNTLEHL